MREVCNNIFDIMISKPFTVTEISKRNMYRSYLEQSRAEESCIITYLIHKLKHDVFDYLWDEFEVTHVLCLQGEVRVSGEIIASIKALRLQSDAKFKLTERGETSLYCSEVQNNALIIETAAGVELIAAQQKQQQQHDINNNYYYYNY